MARDWSTLSYELLLQIMQQLPQEDRLRAGLCCSTWRAAANAVTDSVQLLDCDEACALVLLPWLQQHGPQITSMQIKLQEGMQLGKLPCNNLRELVVGDFSRIYLPLLPPTALTSLTKLSLQSDTEHGAPRLVASTDLHSAERQLLQELRAAGKAVEQLFLGLDGHTPLNVSSEDVWDSVQHLQHLTHLEVQHIRYIMTDCKARIRSLTNLQRLYLHDSSWDENFEGDVFDGWHHLQHLTELKLFGDEECSDDLEFLAHSASSLGQLTGLRTMHLGYCDVELAVLSAITGLHTITLDEVFLTQVIAPDSRSPTTLLQT